MASFDPNNPTAKVTRHSVSRRSLIAGGVVAAGGLAGYFARRRRSGTPQSASTSATRVHEAPTPVAEAPAAEAPLTNITPPAPPDPPALIDTPTAPPVSVEHRLAHRTTWGMTPADMKLIRDLGYDGYLDQQLDHQAVDDADCDRHLQKLESLRMPSWDLYQLPEPFAAHELITAAMVRAVFSKRQLFERTVHFWNDHFNIDIGQDSCRWLKTVDDREVIRRHALGTVPDLVHASTASPAMLFYLDNYASVKGNPNENYARELLELHTLGVDSGYTLQDIIEVARCFTGWTFQSSKVHEWGKFEFRPERHDDGEKKVLGFTIPPGGGIEDGRRVVDILTREPRFARLTAAFIGRKLARWFWGYEPPQRLVESVVETYMGTGGSIPAMVRTILQPEWMATAPPKFKRPFHLMASSLRALSVDQVRHHRGLLPHMKSSGHLPFHWSTPDGYPDDLRVWTGLLLPRFNFAADLLEGEISGVRFKLETFLQGAEDTEQIIARLDEALFDGLIDPYDKASIAEYLQPDPPTPGRTREAVAIALSSPGFQWY